MLKLSELKPGDKVRGFEGWGCIPPNAKRTVQQGEHGLFVKCKCGAHWLDGQCSDQLDYDTLPGMSRA
jgi:hypothetical protein